MGQKIDLTTQVQGILPEVNGGSGPNAGLRFVDAEIPSGAINGQNSTYTLSFAPNPAGSLLLFLRQGTTTNLQIQGVDFTLTGNTVVFNIAPLTGALLRAWYRYISLSGSLAFVEAMQMADAVSVNMIAAGFPLGLVDTMQLFDALAFNARSALQLGDTLQMRDGPFSYYMTNWGFADSLSMSDSIALSLSGIGLGAADAMPQDTGNAAARDWVEMIFAFVSATNPGGPIRLQRSDAMQMRDAFGIGLGFAESMTMSESVTINKVP